MKNKPTPDSDFEKLLQKHLEQLDATPDESTWAEIAAKQRPGNLRLRIRHYGAWAVPTVFALILLVAGWRHFRNTGAEPSTVPLKNHPGAQVQAPEPDPAAPVVDAIHDYPPMDAATAFSGKRYTAPSFGNKVNTVPAATVRFQVSEGLEYQSPATGTSVHIPANSLLDAAGNRVSGEAELFFREYRSIPEFLASGIPMHYTDDRGTFFFNSGGMFEVRVSSRGEALKMAPGQTYDVAFSPTNQLTNASLYYLDDKGAAWRYQPDAAFVSQKDQLPPAQPPVVSEAEVLRNNKRKNNADCLPEMSDMPGEEDPAVFVKEAIQTGCDLAGGKLAMPVWFRKNPGLTNEQLLNGLERTRIRMVRHKDQKELFFPEDVNRVFTELEAFKGCYFTRALDSTGAGKGIHDLSAGQYWQRITVAQERGAYCQITLYGEQGWMQFFANLQGSTGNGQFDPDKVMAEYRRLRTERQNNIEALANRLKTFLHVAPAFQAEEEWCMDASEWLGWFDNNRPLMSKRYEALVKAGLTTDDSLAVVAWKTWRTRLRKLHFDRHERMAIARTAKTNMEYALRLSGFGIYNCDQIFRLAGNKESDYILAGYQTPQGARVVPGYVCVIERSTRLFFTMPTTDKMLRIPGRRLDIVVTDRSGRSYHVPSEKYATLSLTDNLKSNIFTAEDVTDKAQTPREWADLLEM